MDLPSAIQFLLSYEASLKLAPGQKPPPPSPSLLAQLSAAVDTIGQELANKEPEMGFSGLPPSVWSDWPLCCGVDLTSKELKAARSLPPALLRERGLLSLFLALHSCAEAKIGRAGCRSFKILVVVELLHADEGDDPVTFPSAHLAARVGHRLINADDTLNFPVGVGLDDFSTWAIFIGVALSILDHTRARAAKAVPALPALPHEAAGLSLAKETAAIFAALCAAQRGSEGAGDMSGRDLSKRLPFAMCCHLLVEIEIVFKQAREMPLSRHFWRDVYSELAALPAYDPVLLLQSLYRNIDSGSGLGFGSLDFGERSQILETHRVLCWAPLSHRGLLSRLRPADAHTVMRLGLEDLGRQGRGEHTWIISFVRFAFHVLHAGLVQPELILRARPQLLDGLVEGLATGRLDGRMFVGDAVILVVLLTRSPAVGFHLRKFFSRSGCLQMVQRIEIKEAAQDLEDAISSSICDFVIRDLTLDMIRDPRLTQPMLQYLSELAEEIAASKRTHGGARYGVLMVVGIGKACLTFSDIVAGGLEDIGEAGPKGKGVRGSGGASKVGSGQQGWRARLAEMQRELSLLRRRVLHELLPLAEAREAALWEGVREEEVVAALRG